MTTTYPTEMEICSCGKPANEDTRDLRKLFSFVALRCDECAAIEEAEEARRGEILARAAEQTAREARLQVIPPEMMRSRINHPDFNPGLWVRIEGWQPSRLKWLGIIGGAGECKTRCLSLLAKRLILEGHRLMWTTAVEFQDRVDDTLRGDRSESKEAHRYFSQCKSAPILVFDDFGKNTWNPTLERHLFSVIDHRKTHDLPVLWTANTSPLEILHTPGLLSKDRGAPIIGRLLEASTIEKV